MSFGTSTKWYRRGLWAAMSLRRNNFERNDRKADPDVPEEDGHFDQIGSDEARQSKGDV